MKCINCGTELSENAKFCFSCGAKQGGKVGEHTEPVLKLDLGDNVAEYDPNDPEIQMMNQRLRQQEEIHRQEYIHEQQNQGADANMYRQSNQYNNQQNNSQNAKQGYSNQTLNENYQQPKPKKKFPKWIWFAGGGVVAAAIAVTAAVMLLGGHGGAQGDDVSHQYVQFVKDGELNTLDVNRRSYEPKAYSGDQSSQMMSSVEIQYTDDGKYMCYPADWDGEACRVYIVKTNADPSKAEKVDNNISQYWLLNDGRVLYVKDSVMYLRSKKGDKEKVASDVVWADVTEDEKTVMWEAQPENIQDVEDTNVWDIYYRDLSLKDEKQKIISNAYITTSTKDKTKMLVIQDGVLYLIENFSDKKEIDSGVYFGIGFSKDETQFFYYKKAETPLTAMDIVDDDLADADAQMQEPTQEDYQTSKVEKVGDRYEKVETTDWDAYDEAKNAYWEKQNRDDLRESLKETEIESYMFELYAYDNGKISMLDDNVDGLVQWNDGELIYNKLNPDAFEKMKFSEVSYADEVASYYYEHKSAALESYMYASGTTVKLDQTITGSQCRISEDGSKAYALTNDDILISFDFGGTGTTEEIMDDVGYIYGVTDDGVYYLANMNDSGEGDLYYNDRLIDSEVYQDMIYLIKSSNTICYGTDRTDSGYTLKVCDAGKSPKNISDNVKQAFVVSKNRIFVLEDSHGFWGNGDLKLYNGRETLKTISEDISYILNPDMGL